MPCRQSGTAPGRLTRRASSAIPVKGLVRRAENHLGAGIETTVVRTAAGDLRVMGTVGLAHFTSHLLQLVFAPLLPIMRDDLGVGFVELGLIFTVFYACSGLGQIAAGVLVDRFGAHRLLVGGVVVQAGAVLAMGFAPSYVWLLPLAGLAGVGNSVYHPADLTILSHRVRPERLGRAFAVHVIGGAIGFAASPLLSAAVASVGGWRASLVVTGAVGLVVAVILAASRATLETPPQSRHRAEGKAAPLSFAAIVAMPVVLLGFLYFLLASLSGTGIQAFAISGLVEGFGATLAVATLAATLYQAGNAFGVMAGGVAADRTSDHRAVAAGGLLAAGVLSAAIAVPGVPVWAAIALLTASGAAVGLTTPSRDVLVRKAAPPDAVGKVFGVVYSGFDIGALIAPILYGALLDRHLPLAVFLLSGVILALAVPGVLVFGRRAVAGEARA